MELNPSVPAVDSVHLRYNGLPRETLFVHSPIRQNEHHSFARSARPFSFSSLPANDILSSNQWAPSQTPRDSTTKGCGIFWRCVIFPAVRLSAQNRAKLRERVITRAHHCMPYLTRHTLRIHRHRIPPVSASRLRRSTSTIACSGWER
jgi:hypothetical protein